MSASKEIEVGVNFTPKFDQNGLITAISQDAANGQVLMVAYMNEEALKLTLETGNAVFFSRSNFSNAFRGELSLSSWLFLRLRRRVSFLRLDGCLSRDWLSIELSPAYLFIGRSEYSFDRLSCSF